MDTQENGFNAWILIGNVLNALLGGAPAHQNTDGLDRDQLIRLQRLLDPIEPPQMLAALRNLPSQDRTLLLHACQRAFQATGTEAQTVLGLDEQEAAAPLALLSE